MFIKKIQAVLSHKFWIFLDKHNLIIKANLLRFAFICFYDHTLS